MFASRCFSDSKFIAISHTHSIGDQKPLSFRHILLKISFSVGDKEAIMVSAVSVDSSTNKSMFSMRFHIFLNSNDLISTLLKRQVMKVSWVD